MIFSEGYDINDTGRLDPEPDGFGYQRLPNASRSIG